jgi:hypothetical protein
VKPRKVIFASAAVAGAIAFLLVVSSVVLADQNGTVKVEGLPWPKLTLSAADRVLDPGSASG